MIDSTSYRSPNYNERTLPITGIVLHTTEGAYPSDVQWLCNDQIDLRRRVSSHYYIRRDGTIYRLVDEAQRAWHAGAGTFLGISDWNSASIGIECEHREDQDWPAVQRAALTNLCRDVIARIGIAPDHIIAHRWLRPDDKRDPTDWPNAEFLAWRATLVPTTPIYTADSPILGTARIPTVRWIRAITRRQNGLYTWIDIQTILGAYAFVCADAGVNADLAIAQMCHETAWLSSWWAQRPRRNPAGIGVTGNRRWGYADIPPGEGWAYNETLHAWFQGVSFASWASHSVPAHVGRLLAYATRPSERTTAQQARVDEALRYRDLPDSYHGSAPTLAGLDGRWAVPGDGYGGWIAATAESLARAA